MPLPAHTPMRLALASLLLSALLSACSEKPEAMLASAQQYLAQNDSKAAIIQIKNALQANPTLAQARLLLGTTLLDSGDAAGAETELRRALALKASHEAVVPALARALLAQGQGAKLREEFAKEQLGDATAQADLQLSLSHAYAQLDQGERAEAMLHTVLQTKPDYAPALLEQARNAASQGDPGAALGLIARVTQADAHNLNAWLLQGDIQASMPGHMDEAVASYRQALALQPSHLPARTALIMVLLHKPDLTPATQEFAQMQKLAPKQPSTAYLQALLAFHQKDFAAARTLVQQALAAAPGNLAALQLAGATELQLDHLTQAQTYLTQAVVAAPDMPLPRRLLVLTYLGQRQADKALSALQPALRNAPLEPGMAELAGEAYLRNGQFDQADHYFKEAQQENPRNTSLRTSQVLVKMLRNPDTTTGLEELQSIASTDKGTSADMALISAQLQRRAFVQALQAIAALDKKLPTQALAPYLRARVQLGSNDTVGARRSLEQALAREGGYFPAVAGLAALDLADNHPQDARKRFDALLQKDPSHVPALMALAEWGHATGAPADEQAKWLARAVAADPGNAAARLAQVEFFLRRPAPQSALAAAQSAVAALPKEPHLLDALGRSQQAHGDINQAIATFHQLAELMPQSPLPHWRLANAQIAAKDKEGAMQSLRRAAALQPDFLEGQNALIGLYMSEQRQQEALSVVRQIETQRPTEDTGYLLEADVWAANHNWEQAAQALRRGQKQANSTLLAIRLQAVLRAQGKGPEADQLAQHWLQAHPSDAAYHFYLGDKSLALRDLDDAERHYRAVLALQPDNALALNNLAWISGQLKKDGAIAYAERAVKLSPKQPDFLDTLAGLRSDKGDYTQALALQAQALALQPQNPRFKLNLARIQLRAGRKELARQSLDDLSKLGDAFAAQADVAVLRRAAAQP